MITSEQSIIERGSLRSFLGIPLVVVGVLLAFSGSAFAVRAHEFSKAIKPEGAKALKEPAGVAVNETSGDVYVVDKGNNRVEYFSAAGAYLGQFNGSGASTGAFSSPEAIAVDNSCVGGALECADPSVLDVYVVDAGHHVIDKFSATGTYIGQITEAASAAFGSLGSAVVDTNGRLWLCEAGGINSVAVDAFSNAQTNAFLFSKKVGVHGASAHPICAVNAQDDLFVDNGESLVKYGSGGVLIVPPIDEEPASGIAIDLATSDVYVDEISGVSRFTPEGTLLERLAVPGGHGSGVAVSSATDILYVADSSADVVDVYPPASLPPTIDSESASGVTSSDATLEASINSQEAPAGDYYQFQLVRSPNEYASEILCPTMLPPGTDGCIGTQSASALPIGFIPGNTMQPGVDHPVSLDLASAGVTLQPATTYHYRVIAARAVQTEDTIEWKAPTVYGPDQEFTTPKSEEEGWFKRFAEENAKKIAEEAAAREAATKQEAAAKKHQEEETAAASRRKQEEEAGNNPRGVKAVTSKVLTKAQKLAKALAECKREPKRKRPACVKRAKKKYGSKAKSKKTDRRKR